MKLRFDRFSVRRRRAAHLVAALALSSAIGVTFTATAGSADAAEVSPAPLSGQWSVDGRGNGHGHGLSQYGARGAAIAGLNATQIIGFYYPGTALVTAAPITIRVQITDTPQYPTVAASSGISLTGAGALPVGGGIARYRLVPSGAGFAVQKLVGATWSTVKTGIPATANFASTSGLVRTFHSDGSYTDYRGTVGGVRSGAGAFTINRVSLENYLRGVVPREMPSSWQVAAVQAQAIAARSYARYAIEHNSGTPYDICDTANCQVYGGAARYSAGNVFEYGEEAGSNAAVAATPNRVATWSGRTIFAQFSASNGGVMAAGSQPYLVTKQDPYDNASSGDPYLSYVRTASVSRVASYYGLSKVTEIRITARAGGGIWGGIVTAGYVDGLNSSGAAVSIPATGPRLASVLGMPYQYFHIKQTAPVGHVDTVAMVGPHSWHVRGWVLDPMRPSRSSQVRVYVGAVGHVFAANLARPDVQAAYKTAVDRYGFDAVVSVPDGTYWMCFYAMDAALVTHSDLGCRMVSAGVNG
jgi:peptidoglycan hydrolase-like amidase